MTTTMLSKADERGFEQYQIAEQAVWEAYGLAPREKLLDLAPGRQVRINEVGTGNPILFVHGSGGSGVYWAPLVRILSDNYRCILMDRPGWTRSTPIDYAADDFGTVAADLQGDVLKALGIKQAHVIGSSIGNVFVLRLAQRYPDLVDRVVLIGAGPIVQDIRPPTFIRLLGSPLGQIMVRIPQKPNMIRKQVEGLGHKTSLDEGRMENLVNIYAATSRYTNAMTNERDLVKSILTRNGWVPGFTLSVEDIAHIGAPTLMIYGEDDPVGSTDVWRRFTTGLPHGSLHLVPQAGHLPWYDAPEEVAGHIIEHFAKPSEDRV